MKTIWAALGAALVIGAAQADTTTAGHTYQPPAAFAVRTEGHIQRFVAPEGNATLTLVELDDASDARQAVERAWSLAEPGFARKLELTTPRADRDGWTAQQDFMYETSPNERLLVSALARRVGDGPGWVVVIEQGDTGTLEKRHAPIAQFVASMRPKGYVRETFAGRKPLPLTPERVAQLKAFVADGMRQLDVPGVALAFIDGGKVVWEGGLGVRRLGSAQPVDADTVFMAASNTKTMTTALLAQAVDAGKLRWDQPAQEAYAGFRLADPAVTRQVQIKHLVCACTGMPRQDIEWLFAKPREPARVTFDQLAQMTPTSGFGELFQYSNLMVAAGGYIAASTLRPGMEVGAAYDQAMQRHLFDPLGMTHTTFDFARAARGNHASPHSKDLAGRTQVAEMGINHTIIPARPAGGVWISAHDMARWVQMELNQGRTPEGRRLISEVNWAERYRPQVMVSEDLHYGMGLEIDTRDGVRVAKHGGDMFGYHSDMAWLPELGLGMVILTNADSGYWLRAPLLRKLLEVVFDGRPQAEGMLKAAAATERTEDQQARERLTHPVPEAARRKLAKRYANPQLGVLHVTQAGHAERIAARQWRSDLAWRRNEDGSESYTTVSPSVAGFEFVRDDAGRKPALVLRDNQHEYRFESR